jgi:cobalt-zinc-cadmium efflux system protein
MATHHDHGDLDTHGRARLTAVLVITVGVLVVEVVGSIVADSLALLADAGHMLTDVAGLSLAVIAARLSGRPASDERTWGYRRAEVLAAAAQAAVLLAVGAYILIEAIRRLWSPSDVDAPLMLAFGVVGLAGNILAISVLASARRDNLNMRAAFLEVVNDALGSAAVIVAAVIVAATSWHRIDAVASLVIGGLILPRTLKLLRAIHDLHASQVATGLPTFSAHVVVDDDCFHDGHLTTLLDEIQDCLAGHFDVEHSTIQFEASSHADHEPSRHD